MSTDTTRPEGPWEFGQEVADVFENMLARSIPGFAEMRRLVRSVAKTRLLPILANQGVPLLVDLGCSDGQSLEHVSDGLGVECVGYDISEPMLAAAKRRLPDATIVNHDIRFGVREEEAGADVILSVLTLQFVGVEYRQVMLSAICEALADDGVFIIVEKVSGETAVSDVLLGQLYYQFKHEQGYSTEAIERKRLSLEGVLSPLAAVENERRFLAAGFTNVECFWRNLNFVAWACHK